MEIDTWEKALGKANENARKAGVTSICEFTGTEQASQEGLHPYGGHLFSIFPWSHLIFTEKAQIRWLSNALTREFTTSVVRCTLIPKVMGSESAVRVG